MYNIQFRLSRESEGLFGRIRGLFRNFIQRSQNKVANRIAENVKTTFLKQGERGGHPKWIPTSEIALSKRKVGRNNGLTLVDAGELMDSIKGEVEKNADNFLITIDSDVPYAHEHNDGDHIYYVDGGAYNVPQREFLFMTDGDTEDVIKIYSSEPLEV